MSDESHDPVDAARWHPEPALVNYRNAAESRPALEALGRAAWATALDYVYGEGFRRGMGEPTEYRALRRAFFGAGTDGAPLGPAPAPATGLPSVDVLAEFARRVAPHNLNCYHPRSLSYFTPPPLALSVAGELLAQWLQQGIDVWHAGPVGALVEEEVVGWLCDLVGYGEGSFGLLASGGVMANFMALALARDVHLKRLLGLREPPRGRALEGARAYASDQSHFSIARALDELGFPREALRIVNADADLRLRGAAVAAAIAEDRAQGLRPFAIAAVAGSTNTGAVDATDELADLARAEDLWLHVDAAYGAAVRLSATHAHLVSGLELADSVTVDPHKWFFQAYDIGGLVVRREQHLAQTFQRSPEYYRAGSVETKADHGEQPLNFYQLGMEGTRRLRALKLWMSWKHLGSDGLGRLVEANLRIARYLSGRLRESPDFEPFFAQPPLSVVCFRHLRDGLDGEALDRHQDALQRALEASGDGWLSTTRLRGRTWLRAGIMNWMTTEEDVDRLLETLRQLGRKLTRSLP